MEAKSLAEKSGKKTKRVLNLPSFQSDFAEQAKNVGALITLTLTHSYGGGSILGEANHKDPRQ